MNGGGRVRALVVDDHDVARAGIGRLLDGEPDLEVVAETGSGHQAVALCRADSPDVVVLDDSLPDLDSLETTRQIVELGCRTRILVLTIRGQGRRAARLVTAPRPDAADGGLDGGQRSRSPAGSRRGCPH